MYWPAMHADRGSERLRPPPAHVSVATGGLVRENLRSDRRDFRDVRVEPRPERVRVTGSLRTLAAHASRPRSWISVGCLVCHGSLASLLLFQSLLSYEPARTLATKTYTYSDRRYYRVYSNDGCSLRCSRALQRFAR